MIGTTPAPESAARSVSIVDNKKGSSSPAARSQLAIRASQRRFKVGFAFSVLRTAPRSALC